jgi:predicted acyltransferase
VPGYGAGVLTPEGCITAYLDRALLPWSFNAATHQMYDSQGLFVTIPAIVTCLLGCFTGQFLRKSTLSKYKNTLILLVASGFCFGLGSLWETQLFISKELWNPPFIFHCAGYSLALLGIFYGIIDALGFWRWSFFFIVIGMNPITIYFATRLINFHQPANFIFGGIISKIQPSELQNVWSAIAFIATWWLFLLFLYRKKIFLKV